MVKILTQGVIELLVKAFLYMLDNVVLVNLDEDRSMQKTRQFLSSAWEEYI